MVEPQYTDHLQRWDKGTDYIDFDNKARRIELNPFNGGMICVALGFAGMKERISIVDKAIQKAVNQ